MKGEKEKCYWNDISLDMMSEEDRVGDQYIRHPPAYRSEKVKKFINKLEKRLEKKGCNKLRFVRVEGSPHKVPIPPNLKKWTIQTTNTNTSSNKDNQLSQETATDVTSHHSGQSDNEMVSDSEFSVSDGSGLE